MSEVRRGGYSYTDTYVESVEWQRDKAYARAEKAERERDEANAALLNIRELHFKDGNLDASVAGEGAAAIAMTLVGFYRAQGGANYVEMQLGDKKTGERFTVTVQRVAGKTPHELRTAAEARADRLAAALREIAEHGDVWKLTDPDPEDVFRAIAAAALAGEE